MKMSSPTKRYQHHLCIYSQFQPNGQWYFPGIHLPFYETRIRVRRRINSSVNSRDSGLTFLNSSVCSVTQYLCEYVSAAFSHNFHFTLSALISILSVWIDAFFAVLRWNGEMKMLKKNVVLLYVLKRQTASQDQLRLFPSCSPAVGEDSPGEPPMDSYGLATAYPKQQQQQHYDPDIMARP